MPIFFGPPRPLTDAAAWFAESNIEQERGESLRLLIVDLTSDRFLGSLSLWTYEGETASAEIGLWTVADERDEGSAVGRCGRSPTGLLPIFHLERIVGRTDPDNVASRTVMELLGFELIGPVGDQVAYEYRSPVG